MRGGKPPSPLQGVTNELLKIIPAFRERDGRLLVCATNFVRALDPAFLRHGRFDYVIPIGAPDAAARAAIWRRYIPAGVLERIDLDALVEASELFTPADIEFAARKGSQRALETAVYGDERRRPQVARPDDRRLPRRARRDAPDADDGDRRRVHRGHRDDRAALSAAAYRGGGPPETGDPARPELGGHVAREDVGERAVTLRPVAKSEYTTLEVAGREVRLSNPAKVYFPKPGWTKLDVAEYYLAVADAALIHVRERPGR